MTQNIITADQIQKGDLIRVTLLTKDGGRKRTEVYEGVAATLDPATHKRRVWRTADDWNLYVHVEGAVVELLERPKPPIVLPTGEHAVVTYRRTKGGQPFRHAYRLPSGEWAIYYEEGTRKDTNETPLSLARIIDNYGTDFKVIFEGVSL